MLDRLRNSPWFRATSVFLLLGVACGLASCATKAEPQLVSSGAENESSIPWNEQQRWETTGQLGPLAEHMENKK
jgi:hypothetical protein